MFQLSKKHVMYGILALIGAEYLWESFITIRQLWIVSATTELPSAIQDIMTKEAFDKSKSLTVDQLMFILAKNTIVVSIKFIVIQNGYLAKLWYYVQNDLRYRGEVAISCMWYVFYLTFGNILDTLLGAYYIFVIQEKHGVHQESLAEFIWDAIISHVISVLVIVPILPHTIRAIRHDGDQIFVWTWIIISISVLLTLLFMPILIITMFMETRPLQSGDLRTKIEALAAEVEFPLASIHVVKGPKEAAHSNAFYYGFARFKGIVLYDTLMLNPQGGGLSNDEIIGVLAHELGHWYYMHIVVLLAVHEATVLANYIVFSVAFKTSLLYECCGLQPGLRPILFGLVVTTDFVLSPFDGFVSIAANWLARRCEYQADGYAVKIGKGAFLARALVQLHKDTVMFPVADKFFSACHFDHPTLLERLEAIGYA